MEKDERDVKFMCPHCGHADIYDREMLVKGDGTSLCYKCGKKNLILTLPK
jgi:predicted RNA-binding Zn-ribbon protein involved in translation (DUF1610 family)